MPDTPPALWLYDPPSDRLYQRRHNGFAVYTCIPQRRLRRTRYQYAAFVIDPVPSSAIRTTVDQLSPTVFKHTGTRSEYQSMPNNPSPAEWATHRLHFPDNLHPLVDSLLNGTALAVCDGSFKDLKTVTGDNIRQVQNTKPLTT